MRRRRSSWRFGRTGVAPLASPLVALALALAGCGSPVGARQVLVTAAPYTPPAIPACAPTPAGHTGRWPAGFPPGFPRLTGLHVYASERRTNGERLARFTSSLSLRASVIYALAALPAAGFTIGRGDAEANEADIPFIGGSARGLLRIDGASRCSVAGVLVVVRSGRGDALTLLPSHHHPGSPFFQPF